MGEGSGGIREEEEEEEKDEEEETDLVPVARIPR